MRRVLANPKVRKRRSEGIRRSLSDPEVSRWKSEAMKLRMADPDERKRIIEPMKEGLRRAWDDPEKRKEMTEANRRTGADPEVQKRKSQSLRQTWAADPSRGEKASELFKNVWIEYRSKGKEAGSQRPSSARRGTRHCEDDEPKRILEIYNELTENRAVAGRPRTSVWKEIKEKMDKETGLFRSTEAYKSRLKSYLKRCGVFSNKSPRGLAAV